MFSTLNHYLVCWIFRYPDKLISPVFENFHRHLFYKPPVMNATQNLPTIPLISIHNAYVLRDNDNTLESLLYR